MNRDDLDRLASTHADAIQRHLAEQAGGRCLLLLDPVLRPISADDTAWASFDPAGTLPVRVEHPDVDRTYWPLLAPLDTTRFADSELIAQSLREGVQELQPAQLDAGHGRRIGGWLCSAESNDAVARHLAASMLHVHPDGYTVWLRLHDPAVMWALWSILGGVQRAALLGPIDTWHLLDPAGDLLSLSTPLRGVRVRRERLRLSEAQWADLASVAALNLAMRARPPGDGHPLERMRADTLDALRRARGMGFDDERDLAAFARRAITVHPRFDHHPLVVQRLQARDPDDYFTGLVDDLSDQDWQRIGTDMSLPLDARQPISR